jgi:hypothetical protein
VLTAGPANLQAPSESEVAAVGERLRETGCCYLPGLNTVLVQRFEITQAAEEAARFVCCAGWGDVGSLASASSGEKAFYRACLQNALVEYGSRVLCPDREGVREFDLFALYGSDADPTKCLGVGYHDFERLVDFIVLHRDFERNARHYRLVPPLILEGRAYSGEKFAFVTQWLGRLLGVELYEAYLRGSITKRSVRRLFLGRAEKPKAAYFRLARLCRRQRRLTG